MRQGPQCDKALSAIGPEDEAYDRRPVTANIYGQQSCHLTTASAGDTCPRTMLRCRTVPVWNKVR
ncbi:MAG: hypothetical protein RIS70_4082 [Planctomycetota bacterium]